MSNPRAAAALSLSALLVAGPWGCGIRPERAPWNNDHPTVVARRSGPTGYLLVETPESGSPKDGVQPHERFFVYDQSGKYIDYFNNDVFLPVNLAPGKYSVVTRYARQNRKVQVEIIEGCETVIRLEDFKRAPSIE